MAHLPYHRWSDEDIALLRALYPTEPAHAIADRLGITARKVYSKASAVENAQ